MTMKETSAIINEIRSVIKDWEPKLNSLTNEEITHYRNKHNLTRSRD